MNSIRFERAAQRNGFEPTSYVDGKRAFGYCRNCKVRWVSSTMTRVEQGFRVYSWLGARGWESTREPDTRRTPLAIIHSEECPQCGLPGIFKRLEAIHNPDKKCDARCTSAKGPKCECSCGGDNHGAGMAISLGTAAA